MKWTKWTLLLTMEAAVMMITIVAAVAAALVEV
jgi:hypothetical protein